MRSPRLARAVATAGDAGSRSSSGQVSQRPPWISASAQHVAKSTRPSPSSSRKRSYADCRAGLRGTACTSASACAWPPRPCPGPAASRRCSTAAVRRRSVRPSAGQVVEPGVLLDRLDAQVERAEEPPGDGQVRRGLQRRARRRGVQRVDQHQTGPGRRRSSGPACAGRRGRRRPTTPGSAGVSWACSPRPGRADRRGRPESA